MPMASDRLRACASMLCWLKTRVKILFALNVERGTSAVEPNFSILESRLRLESQTVLGNYTLESPNDESRVSIHVMRFVNFFFLARGCGAVVCCPALITRARALLTTANA